MRFRFSASLYRLPNAAGGAMPSAAPVITPPADWSMRPADTSMRRHRMARAAPILPGESARPLPSDGVASRSEEHTSELQSHHDLVCRLLLEKKKKHKHINLHTNTTTKQ